MSGRLHQIEMVEVEVHSYCNRRCSFCPNSFIDRRTAVRYLPESVYLTMLNDLADAGWDRMISFCRYNEPFANEVFFERLAQASELLPGAHLHTNTNGDFLSEATLGLAYEAGLASIHVQLYAEVFSLGIARAGVQRLQRLLPGWRFSRVREERTRFWWEAMNPKMPGLSMLAYARDFARDGTDRCDLNVRTIPHPPRTRPCLEPSRRAFIDYTGAVMPCCNLRSDYAPHADAVLGWMDDSPGCLLRIWTGDKAREWRKAAAHEGPKSGPCERCDFG